VVGQQEFEGVEIGQQEFEAVDVGHLNPPRHKKEP
jgi:hypothetical protein